MTYEEEPPGITQVSAPRQTTNANASAELGFRFKFDASAGYHVAAEVRAPAALQGNNPPFFITRPVLLRGSEWSYLTYPRDFTGDAWPLSAGDWTVIWYHVRGENQAYFIACDGFKVT